MSQSVYDNWEETLSDEEDLYIIDDIATQPPPTQAPASLGGESESEEDEEEYKQEFLDISDDEDTQTPATQDPGRGRSYAEEDEEEYIYRPNFPACYDSLEEYIQEREDKMVRDAEENRIRDASILAHLAELDSMEEDVESVKDEAKDYHNANVFEEISVSQDNLNTNEDDDYYIASQHDDDDATQGDDDDDDVDMPPSHDPGFHFEGAEISIKEIEESTLFWEENGQPTYTLTLEDYAQGCRQRALRLAKYWYGYGFRCIDGFWFHCIYSPEERRKAKEVERCRKQRRRELKRSYHGTYLHLMEQGLTDDQTFAQLEEIDADSKAWDSARYKRKREEEEVAIGSQMKRLRIEEPVASSAKASSSQRPMRGLGKARRH